MSEEKKKPTARSRVLTSRARSSTNATASASLPSQPLTEEEGVQDIDETAEPLRSRYEITAFGADFDVNGLVRRLDEGEIVVPTFEPSVDNQEVAGFQRQFVWKPEQMDKFVESLLMGLPVPGIYLVKKADEGYLVLDGQQRLRTLSLFKKGSRNGEPFVLKTVAPEFRGRTYATLDARDRRRLDNAIVHATIVRQEMPGGDPGSIYELFSRINTGGTQLRPQEIRVALYHGPLIDLLRELNGYERWRSIYGPKEPSKYLKDHELILRFFALLYSEYTSPMSDFLSTYCSENRSLSKQSAAILTDRFTRTCDAIATSVGPKAFRLSGSKALNAAVCDSVMVGLARRLRKSPLPASGKVASAYGQLLQSDDYLKNVVESTSHADRVQARLQLAKRAFAVLS